jgi:ubiquitin-like domain-containing CTD phosphatase 1
MNPDVCPRLNDLWDEAEKSLEYAKKFVNNRESQELNELMESLGGDFRDQAEDCLMTAICNDRDLPEALDDFGQGHANNYFDRLDKYSFKPFNYVLRYNNAAYSKLAFGPMWVNILSNVLAYIPTSTWHNILPNLVSEVRSPSPTLALFSAHDTTILSILATLGENVWDGQTLAPYASMIVIEIHKVGTGDERRFRLVYNDQILTDKVQGCAQDEELCDVENLLTTVKDFAVKKRNCESNLSPSDKLDTLTLKRMKFKGIAIIFLFTMVSGAVGGLVTYVFLTRRLPCRRIDGKGEFSKAPISAPRAEDGIAITGVPDYGLGSMLDENIIL